MKKLILLLFISTGLSLQAMGQDSLPADRPGAGFTSFITPKNTFILESGASFRTDFGNVGQLYLKTGLTESFELQLNLGSVLVNTSSGSTAIASQSIAGKYSFNNYLDSNLNIALYARTVLPFLNENYEYWSTRVSILADYQLSETVSVNANLGYGDFVNGLDDGSLNFSIMPTFKLNDDLSLYLGYGYLGGAGNTSLFETGIIYKVNSRFQFDAGVKYDSDGYGFIDFGFVIGF